MFYILRDDYIIYIYICNPITPDAPTFPITNLPSFLPALLFLLLPSPLFRPEGKWAVKWVQWVQWVQFSRLCW